MKYSIVIIFITIQLFNGIQSNDTPSKVHPCDLVRCFSATNCPIGTHLKVANRDEGHCCNMCVPAASGENRKKREVNCEGIQCSMPKCGDGYKLVYPNLKEACCPYCEKVANNRRKRALNCDGVQCSPVKCENGFVEVFNKEKQCCPSCEKPNTDSVISRLG